MFIGLFAIGFFKAAQKRHHLLRLERLLVINGYQAAIRRCSGYTGKLPYTGTQEGTNAYGNFCAEP